jgi:hypothetical protein
MEYIPDNEKKCDPAHIALLIGSKVNQLVIIKLLPPSAQEDILRARYHQSNIYGSLALAGMVSLLGMDSRCRVLSKMSFLNDKRECLRLCDLNLEGLLRECANVSRYWCDESPHMEIYRERPLHFAINSPSDINIIRMLLTSGPISDNDRAEGLYNAVNKGYVEATRMLLDSGPISDYIRGRGICEAALEGYANIVEMLLASGPISDKDRGEAICKATWNGHTSTVKMLLASGSISDKDRGVGVCSAVDKGYAEITRMLLASGPISDKDRGRGIHGALVRGNPGIIEMLVTSGFILDVD